MIKKLLTNFLIKRAFKAEYRSYLYESMAFRCDQGFSLGSSIEKYGSAYTEKKKRIGIYLLDISSRVQSGSSIYEAFKGYIPNNELIIISSGDSDVSKMATAFSDAAFLCDEQNKLDQSFKTVLRAFKFKLFLIFGFLLGMSYMITDLINALEIHTLPFYAKALITFSTHLKEFWWAWIIFAILFAKFNSHLLPRYTGRLRPFLSNWIFPYNAYKSMISSSFLISFSSLINGRSHTDALKTIADSADPYLQMYAYEMYENASSGMNSDVIYNIGLFDIFLKINLIDIVNASDSPARVKKLAVREMDISKKRFDKINAFLNGLILLLMITTIMWCYMSIVIPIVKSLSQQLN